MTGIYLEIGKRRVFACAVEWPGWARLGRDQDAALAALQAAAPRYALVCGRAHVPFDASSAAARFEITERVPGSATTDFGALDACADVDRAPLERPDAARLAALVAAAWTVFAEVAAAAPQALRKGPRGGGRDRDAISGHVLETEVLHAHMLGLRHRPFPAGDTSAAALLRADILAAIRAGGASCLPPGEARGRRPPRFVARHTAWHALDHAWEIQDRQGA